MTKQGKHKGIPFIVTQSPIGSYCAYIRIPDDHPWNKCVDKVTKGKIGNREYEYENGYDDIPLEVHGGPTFSRRVKKGEKWPQEFTTGAWVGWDYGHAGDYVPLLPTLPLFGDRDKHWTEGEVVKECKEAIEQMLEAGKGKKK